MWEILDAEARDLSDEYKERQERIRELLRTGDILKIASALRDLAARRQERKLTQADKGLLDQAENMVASELALAKDIEMDEALGLIRAKLQTS